MSEQAARDAVIRMATDPEFREGVRSNDPAVFAGLELSQEEIAQLRSLSSDDSGAGVEQLAARLSKSSLGGFFSSSLASLHGGADASHDAAGSYPPEQHSAASAPVPLTEHAVTFHVTGQDNPTNAAPVPLTEHAGLTPSDNNAPPGGGNYEPAGGFTGGVLPAGAGEAHSLLNHPTDGGPAAQGAPVHHGDASYEKPDKPDGGPKPPKLDSFISRDAANPAAAHSDAGHPEEPDGGGPPPKLDALISDHATNPDAAHSASHGDSSYEKPDKPDGGPKPPKLDALISDHATNPDAAHSASHGDSSYEKPDKPDGGPKPPKLDSFISDRATNPDAADPTGGGFHPADAGHTASHGDSSYEKPDKPDGGPKPPKLDALISDSANVEGAHEQAGQSGYYGGETNPAAEG